MWFLSWDGISKYDGYQFKNFTEQQGLSSNMANDIYENGNQFWLAENNGTVDILENDTVLKKPLAQNIVINRFFRTTKKPMATSDTKGLVELNNENIFSRFTGKSTAYSSAIHLKDSFFLLNHENYSIEVADKNYRMVSSLAAPNLFIRCFLEIDNGLVLAGTKSGLKILKIEKDHQLRFVDLPPLFDHAGLKGYEISDIKKDPDQNFWFATSHGLIKITSDGSYEVFTEKSGLPSNSILCLFCDKQKNLWVSTSLGLAKINLQTLIENYSSDDGLGDNQLYAVAATGESLLLKTTSGLQVYDTKTKNFSTIFKNREIYVNHRNGKSEVYVKGDKEISLLQNNSPAPKLISIASFNTKVEDIFTVLADDQLCFVGTRNGLKVFKGDHLLGHWMKDIRISTLYLDVNNQIWVGTWDKGLFLIKGYQQNISNPQIIDESNIVPDKSIRSIMQDKLQNIWVGTRYKGLACLVGDNNFYRSIYFGEGNGLSSESVRSITEGANGVIWVGTTKGLDKVVRDGKNYSISSFSQQTNYYFLVNDIFIDNNGVLWCASMSGLVRIQPGGTDEQEGPKTFITSVVADIHGGKGIWWNESGKITLPFSKNHIQFEFASPHFVNEKQIFFSYRLLGSSDTSWSQPSNQHNISFVSLQPGHYTFQVHSIGINGARGGDTLFQFTISKPFWKTIWFYFLLAVLFLLIIFLIYRYRIGQLLKMQQVRNNIATDLHDEIGSTLTNINMLSTISRKNIHRPVEAEKYLHRISEEVTTSSQALDDIIWSVNTRNDNVDETFARMRRYSAELFENSETHCTLDFTTSNEAVLKMEKRKDVFLVYKELLNNIVKHSMASEVHIQVKTVRNNLHMIIADNGKGFDSIQPTHRNGLKNLKQRVMRWKGQLNIQSDAKGTVVDVRIPL
jgi:signal transduction histidine kinase/ligand-binding sensor domain-containing protein